MKVYRLKGMLRIRCPVKAATALATAGASHERVQVPGAFEIPAAIALAMVEARRCALSSSA